MQARQEKEMQELDECTFQPSINTRSEYYARRSRSCMVESLPERLFHEADKRASLRNKAKELMEADTLCAYSFQPSINPSSKGANRAPLHLRAEELRQRREQRVRSAQVAEDRRAETLFQPKISNRSERIVQKKRDMLYRCASQGRVDCLRQLGPVEERLYAEAQEKEQRRAALQDFHHDSLQSFPGVDDTSRRICKYSVYFQGPQQDFLARQQAFELAKQKRLEVRAQHADSDCCFHPSITETSRQLVSRNLDLLGETMEERIHRLAIRDAERREQTRAELEQLHHKDCTFKPQINAVSEMLASTSTGKADDSGPHERLYRSALSKSAASEEWQPEESFRPRLDPRSSRRFSHIKSRYANRSDILDTIRQEQERKAEYLLERRRELDEEKSADCTFVPRVKEIFHQDLHKPVAVSGLDRFFELKSLALKKQQEQLEREQRVFRPESVSTGTQEGVTIPEPFELSECKDRNKEFRRPLLDEDCTFAPQTNETHNREMIQQLMGMVKARTKIVALATGCPCYHKLSACQQDGSTSAAAWIEAAGAIFATSRRYWQSVKLYGRSEGATLEKIDTADVLCEAGEKVLDHLVLRHIAGAQQVKNRSTQVKWTRGSEQSIGDIGGKATMRVFAKNSRVALHAASVEQLMCGRCSQVYVPGYNCQVLVRRVGKRRKIMMTKSGRKALPESKRPDRKTTDGAQGGSVRKHPLSKIRRCVHYICRWCGWRRQVLLPRQPQRPLREVSGARPSTLTLAEKKQVAVNEEARNAAMAAKRLKKAKAQAKSTSSRKVSEGISQGDFVTKDGGPDSVTLASTSLAQEEPAAQEAAQLRASNIKKQEQEHPVKIHNSATEMPQALQQKRMQVEAKQEPKAKRRPRQDTMSRALGQLAQAQEPSF
ncbi:HMG1 [Symbiodinium pilosum]|uniref:HMG1 protein n=1 Tax=Symbiodinium pilosum TaxID=2952 RepID=A0A812V3C4_SYMPI|nr:HMG1 [Symbiodinium pilosum]